MNFFIQDFWATLFACLLFPLILLIPGYIFARSFNLFDFTSRRPHSRVVISIALSFAISPIIVFWMTRFGSIPFAIGLLVGLDALSVIFLWKDRELFTKQTPGHIQKLLKTVLWITGGWVLFAIFFLIDVQIGDRLYFSAVSFDLTTRISIIEAISRTGVPPINPGFFQGELTRLNFLYYFWYIPCSMVDILGGKLIDSRHAMIASIAWCGLGLFSVIALYLRLRDPLPAQQMWKRVFSGIGMLAISGLDAYPALLFMISTRLAAGSMWPEGDIEHWNEQITAWVSALAWVPHHVASLIACIIGFLLIETSRQKTMRHKTLAALFSGLAFASAAGLSMWMTLVFVLFWGIWLLYLAVVRKEYATGAAMVLTGLIALIAISPFLIGLLQSDGGASSQASFPLGLRVRIFRPATLMIMDSPQSVKNIVNTIFLPLNYFLELGFFLVAAYTWLKRERSQNFTSSWVVPELTLFSSSVFIGTFVTSTLIANNDLGWRSWMFGQFIMLIWAVDIVEDLLRQNPLRVYLNSKSKAEPIKTGRLLASLALFGIFTSLVSVIFLRTWPILIDLGVAGFPNQLSADTNLGQRTFAARQAYEYIRDNTPTDSIIQYNPDIPIDRPSGLYGTRQMVISDHSAYGVPVKTILETISQVKAIFELETASWDQVQRECQSFEIDFLIVRDLDPLWRSLGKIAAQRAPVYQNNRFAVLDCR